MPLGIPAYDHAVFPPIVEGVCGHAGRAGVGVGAEVPHARVNVQLAVWGDPNQPVEAIRPRGVEGLAHADPDHLRPATRAALRLLGLPAESLRALVQRVAQIGTRDLALAPAVPGLVVGCVEAADRHAVDAEMARGLVDEGLDRHGDLVLSRSPLGTCRRGVGRDLEGPKIASPAACRRWRRRPRQRYSRRPRRKGRSPERCRGRPL